MKVLLSIKPQYVEKILDGTKKFEFRKVLFRQKNIKRVIIYSSSPVKQVVGEFEIRGLHTDKKEDLWRKTSNYSGIEKAYYDEYFAGKEYANAIEIGKVIKYKVTKKLSDYKVKQAPQSYCYVEVENV